VKFQLAQGIEKGGAGVAGLGAEVAVGASIAQQIIQQPTPASGASLPELIGPAEAAAALGVSESDVIASLELGDLKGKKIGTQWRITKQALHDFLRASS
jgi:excisionase family DNA binding protein